MAGNLTAMIAAAFAGGVVSDPYFEYTTLLLPGNGTNGAQNNTFLDASTNNFTITRNGNTTQGTFSPFSQTGWSGSFNTSTTYLTVTDTSNLRFGSSNFTIEAFVYRAASGATQTIASKGASTPTGWVFQISSADKLVFTDTSTSITGATSLAANTWYYVAVVRAGTGSNQTTLYVNAVSDATGTSATTFSQTDNMKIGADRSNTNFANGYISNLRLSNTNRTISSTPTSALTADANTIFLGLYNNRFQYTDSTAAFTNMSVTGTPSVQAFSPFNPSASWSAATYGGSGYFDGTGDYLTVPDSDAFTVGSGNWTLEAWVYPLASPNQPIIIGQWSGGTDGSIAMMLSNDANRYLRGLVYSGGYVDRVSTASLQLNAWNHCAFVREGTALNLYLNGSRVDNYSFGSGTIQNSSLVYSVGAGSSGVQPANAYISNARLVVGTALYSGATYTVPTAPLTAITNTSLLLNYTNAGIYDATSKNDLETVGNAQISTAISAKWGSGCMAFDGTGDYLFLPSSNILELGSGDYTIEFWLYATSLSGSFSGVIDTRTSAGVSTNGFYIYFSTSQLIFAANGSSIVTYSSFPTGVWKYVAITRSGSATNNTKLFIDGTQQSQGTNTTNFTQTSRFVVGTTYPLTGDYLNGYLQDLRITKGVARTITASPTSAFPIQ